jgi:hypothetical protein
MTFCIVFYESYLSTITIHYTLPVEEDAWTEMKGAPVFIFLEIIVKTVHITLVRLPHEVFPDCDLCLVRQIPHAWVRRNGWPSISSKILLTGKFQGLGNLCISLHPRTIEEIGRKIIF